MPTFILQREKLNKIKGKKVEDSISHDWTKVQNLRDIYINSTWLRLSGLAQDKSLFLSKLQKQ